MGKRKLDKDSVEYYIYMELENYCVLRALTFRDFHGQLVGEDPEFDRLERRERKARRELIAKIEAFIEKSEPKVTHTVYEPKFVDTGEYDTLNATPDTN